ncbi:MAG TPA: sarcosine oxidase subunit gamma family protein, partial [Stellaceae bacterium]|nr:sarcosine oxidase subunit gamma family protein [Stellaceae bacterium]
MADPTRFGVFDAATLALPDLSLSPAPPAVRLNLRARGEAVAAAGTAYGVTLPVQACRVASVRGRAALWLGPDEWLLIAENDPAVAPALAAS